jgi:hypothetical protein
VVRSQAAFDAIAATLPVGSRGYENAVNEGDGPREAGASALTKGVSMCIRNQLVLFFATCAYR